MTKLLSPILADYGSGTVAFHCPGCDSTHAIPVADTHNPGKNWGYNGNPAAPTFTPSILVRQGHYAEGRAPGDCYCTWDDKDEFPNLKCGICHSFVTDGRIQFLGDCTHELAGQTVLLPNWPTDGDAA